MIGIYKIENKINGKVYIGQSKDIKRRWNQHIDASSNPKHPLYYSPLYTDMRVLGLENFEFSIVEEVKEYNKHILDSLEEKYMREYGSLINGYNISANAGQRIAIQDIETGEVLLFTTFDNLETYLRKIGVTYGRHLSHFFKTHIKTKEPIYEKYYIYYWKEQK